MRWISTTLITICILSWAQSTWADSIAIKPATPVQISIVPETAVAPGSTSIFVVRASSSLPSNDFHIDVTPLQGTELLAGDLQWRGAIYPGQVHELRITVRFPGQGTPTLSATASIQSGGSAQLAASAVYRPERAAPSAFKAIRPQRHSSRNGRPVVEYTLK